MIDDIDEFESISLIRFPAHIAAEIDKEIKAEEDAIKAAGRADTKGVNRLSNRLSIKWNQDKRNCTSIWKTENESTENIIMKGKLCDMPTIVETYKTTDKKTFYKSGTISQMIVCAENEADINPRNTKYNGTKDARRFQLLGGLAPPLKNVKKRRFRKIIRKRHCEAPEVEKELKQLLRQDMDAISVDFELIPDPDYEKKKSGKISSSAVPDMSSSDEDQSDEDEKPDFEQHLKWIIREEDGRSRRLKEQAAKYCHDINKLRERTNNRQRDLDSAHKEEKKERLRLEIEDIKIKEKDKEKLYFETVEKFNKRMQKLMQEQNPYKMGR